MVDAEIQGELDTFAAGIIAGSLIRNDDLKVEPVSTSGAYANEIIVTTPMLSGRRILVYVRVEEEPF